MSIIFYTQNYQQKYFVYAEKANKSFHPEVQYEILNDYLQIASDGEEGFPAYLVEAYGNYVSDISRFRVNPDDELSPEELKRFLLIYIPSDTPALFAIEEQSHDGLARLNISHYERAIPVLNNIFRRHIAPDDLPDLSSHRMPDEWLQR